MDEVKLTRCDPDDPRRCKTAHRGQQCPYLAEENDEYCVRHAFHVERKVEKANIRNYHLTKFRARLEDKIASPKVKTLTEEVGILRLVLESVLEKVKDDFELILYSSKITELVTSIRSTLEVSMKIEEKANLTLDRGQVMVIASKIIDIISKNVDEANVSTVAEQILLAFEVEDGVQSQPVN